MHIVVYEYTIVFSEVTREVWLYYKMVTLLTLTIEASSYPTTIVQRDNADWTGDKQKRVGHIVKLTKW